MFDPVQVVDASWLDQMRMFWRYPFAKFLTLMPRTVTHWLQKATNPNNWCPHFWALKLRSIAPHTFECIVQCTCRNICGYT